MNVVSVRTPSVHMLIKRHQRTHTGEQHMHISYAGNPSAVIVLPLENMSKFNTGEGS